MEPGQIIVFDVETTGTDRRRDQIIELCVQTGLEPGAESRVWRIRPAVPISPGAQAVHGISMEDLAGCQPFAAYADEIRAVFAGAQVLVGYNMSFDIDMLQAEYERLREPRLALDDRTLVDAFRLWQQCEPRSLQHAHQRFVGATFEEAHSATADVAATGRVLRGMITAFGLSGRDWSSIASVCEPERSSWVGSSRHIRWTEDGTVVFNFGKHAATPVHELAAREGGGYLRWVIDADFPPHVHAICRKALELPAPELHAWVQSTFGPPGKAEAVDVPAALPAEVAAGEEAAAHKEAAAGEEAVAGGAAAGEEAAKGVRGVQAAKRGGQVPLRAARRGERRGLSGAEPRDKQLDFPFTL